MTSQLIEAYSKQSIYEIKARMPGADHPRLLPAGATIQRSQNAWSLGASADRQDVHITGAPESDFSTQTVVLLLKLYSRLRTV